MKIYTTAREDYLKAILVLSNKTDEVHAVDIARYLNYSKPSVCHAVSLLTSEGFIYVDEKKAIHFTEKGEKIAKKTYERHAFFSQYFIYLGVDEKVAQEDACRMEHAISDESFQKLKEKFGKEINFNPFENRK